MQTDAHIQTDRQCTNSHRVVRTWVIYYHYLDTHTDTLTDR